ncbi:MAG: hypothetical protein N3G21_00940 [Candidatus Hydrogenedentes bacterium]|nr:hypothetical protein [Candidatus Hydrogenedentota bacterium]
MNRKVIIIFFVIVGGVIGVPFLAVIKNQLGENVPQPSTPPKVENNSPSLSQTPVEIPQTPIMPQPNIPAIPTGPPDFTGSVWQVNTPYGAVQVQLNPGGQAVASHPMVGTVMGTWRQSGYQVFITANFMGQTYNISADVCGNTLCYQGKPIMRLR